MSTYIYIWAFEYKYKYVDINVYISKYSFVCMHYFFCIFFLQYNLMMSKGMVVGENSKTGDMDVNPCRAKKLTNMR